MTQKNLTNGNIKLGSTGHVANVLSRAASYKGYHPWIDRF